MQVYLPIAEMSVDALLLLGIGFGVGWLSGLFGVGGGFLLTPLLILIGIPSTVAVGSGANQTLGASVSGLIAQWRRGNVDFRMGAVLIIGGFFGSLVGVQLFAWLRRAGQVDLAVAIFYVVVLGSVGALMVRESLAAILRRKRARPARLHEHLWMHGLPFKMRFRKSRLYISVIPPLGIGFAIGVLSAIMGVGGGFMLVPAMIYLLGMPTAVVIGTSLFQVVFVTANVTFLQAIQVGSVDIVLTLLLLAGGVSGAQFGAAMGTKLRGEEMRALLGALVLAVALSLLWDLLRVPEALFVIGPVP
ncbi:sulfite exporter TauE/SafE family protein [Falsiroseomonas sp.]|uniref:sulfite exporter TauE/SafE family protein n=1 Tax=Falsiroseomonas sp. TaxID=2870721 RepID=UPI002715F85B|nr:sulfite exporter TauE/SafE family protein [Falsiroseomonas sp.]MDO9503577.1 sulfite exporter TauE/SafE family protein [Falsiroseomonas sp.]MDP3418557.1 sulfite exporter TauE/SafE family protein [Falsiroseomonas sp.]